MRTDKPRAWPNPFALVVLLVLLVPQVATPVPGPATLALSPRSLTDALGTQQVASATGSSMVTFQQGVDGYTGAVDTFIAAAAPGADNSAAPTVTVDGSPLQHLLIRFDDIFGGGAGQIPPGATIQSATLTVNVTNVSANAAAFHRMLQSWGASSTWDSLVGGVQADGIEAVATADLSSSSSATGQHSVAVTASVAAWSAGGTNLGWALLPGGTDGWGFDSSEAVTPANRPKLIVTFTTDLPPDPPTGESPPSGSTDVSPNPTLCVDVSDPDGDPLAVTFKGRPAGQPAPQDFTIIALPDTQFYAQSFPSTFSAQTQWIVDNLAGRNIAFVTQLGDCTNDGNTLPGQWTTADAAFSLLEDSFTTGLADGIPFGIAPGNHDQTPIGTARSGADEGTAFGGAGGTFGGTTQLYNQTFGAFRFQGRGYFGGNYDFGVPGQYSDSMDNHYELFSASGMDFIIFHLEWDDTDNPTRRAVLSWMHTLLGTTYGSRRAIISGHYLLNTNGTFSNQGQATFNAIKDLPNVFLMLAGHLDQANRRTDLADDGHSIHTLLSDYQSRPNGGNGWLRIMAFSPAGDTFHVQTYSPTLGQFINNHPDNTAGTAQNDFVLSYDMDSGTPFTTIGTVPDVPSGEQACIGWPGRETGQEYEWFAEVSDGELTTTGPLWTFTASCATSAECDDALACTTDTCNGGACLHSQIPGCCATNAECDDTDPCTNDACNLSSNNCENAPIDCGDGNGCTGPDVCVGGVCQNPYTPAAGCCSSPADCDDGMATTTDACAAGTCSNVSLACLVDSDCSDGDACTTDTCSAVNLQSLVLDGVDDHVTMGAAAGLNASPSFTVEAWINGMGGTGISSGTQGLSGAIPLVAKGAPQEDAPSNLTMNYFLGLDIEGSSRRLAADFEDAATGLNHPVCSTTTFTDTDSDWHHVAATYSVANGWSLYVDGVAQTLTTDNPTCTTCLDANCTTTPGATPEPGSIQHFGIGTALTSTGGVNGRYQGRIDEVRVWNVERSATEIADARDELIESAPNLIAHYGFDDSTADDSTLPAENGSLVGSPAFDSLEPPDVAGACLYLPLNCDDGDPCTADSCNAGGCLHIPANDGGACDDGIGCTTDDICTNGVCGGTLGCDDGNACTGTDQCAADSCQNPYNPTPGCCTGDADCDDGDPGTADSCSSGDCSNVSLVCATGADCNDGDACTSDACVGGNVSALNFDGTNDYVTMGAAAGEGALGAVDFTLEAWIRRDGTTWGTVASTGTGGVSAVPLVTKGRGEAENSNVDANYFLGITAGGRLVADFEQSQNAGGWNAGQNHPACGTGTTTITDDEWHHAAVTYSAATGWRIYLDGVEGTAADATSCTICDPVGSCPQNPAVNPRSDSIQHFGLGTAMNSSGVPQGYFAGVMDEARVWNRALTPVEIAAGMDQEILAGSGLIGRWGMNENGGTTAVDSATPAENGILTESVTIPVNPANGPVWSPSNKPLLASGACSYTPIPGCLQCSTAADCNDGNACTTDACVDGACTGTPVVCDDGNACNGLEVCNPSAGSCMAGTPLVCADANLCTNDSCNPATGCVYIDNNAPCAEDGNPCTDDTCSGGSCSHPNDDSNTCADANSCTGNACVNGACLGWYSPSTACCDSDTDCNDSVPATSDSCAGAPDGSCANVITASCSSHAACNDFNGCTADVCSTANISALNFDGINDYVTMGAAAGETALGARAFTLEAWIRQDGATWGATTSTGTGGVTAVPLITKGRGEAEGSTVDANYFLGITATGRLVADFEQFTAAGGWSAGQNHPACSTASIAGKEWHHVAVSYSTADGWRMYLNGAEGTTADATSCTACSPAGSCPRSPAVEPQYNSIQHFGLGTAMNSSGVPQGYFAGVMDEARVWNRALTAAEIVAGMGQEIPSGSGLIGRWGLNENGGTSALDSAVPAQDGTLTESTTLPVIPANGAAWSPSDKAVIPPGACSSTPIANCEQCSADFQCNDSNTCTADSCNTTNDAAVSFPSPGSAANRVNLALGSGSNANPDYVNFFGTGSFTVEGWVYTDGGAASLTGIFRGGQQGAFPQVAVQLTGTGSLQIAGSVETNTAGTQVDVTHGTALTANTWAHFAFVVDRTPGNQQLRLHLNGGAPAVPTAAAMALLGTNAISFTSQSMIGAARDAAGAVVLPFDGRLDEIRIWNYARTQSQTAADMGREIASATGLVHRWSFNEGSLTTATDSAGGINGTLAGAATWSATNLPFAGSDSCVHTSLQNGASCSDDNQCTQNDSCQAGACTPGSPAPSGTACGSSSDTACDNFDTCNGAGACQANNEPDGAPCSDGNACNGLETCQSASCTIGTPVTCADDGNPCTDEVCDSVNGCVHLPNSAVLTCYTGPGGTQGVGACQAGTATCSGGSLGACIGQVTPISETCDGADNDCNGVVDNSFSLGVACTSGTGVCEASGVTVCSADQLGTVCNATPGPTTGDDTDCDAVDDDCDGETDEGYAPVPATCGVGACAATGQSTCTGGQVGSTCQAGPTTGDDTDCDAIDDDSDGETDEGYAPVPTTCGVGACAATGQSTCTGGQVGSTCQAGPTTGDDTDCDAIDDDCDGETDEGYAPVPTTCGVGACAATGSSSCVSGSVVDSCTPGPAGTETCNGLDDDCDGTADEALGQTTCGVGACVRIVDNCVNGQEQVCTPGPPGVEICNGLDDDCDTLTDEEPEGSASCDDNDPGTLDSCVTGSCRHLREGFDVAATCRVTPTRLNVRSSGRTMSFQILMKDAATGAVLDPLLMGPIHLSKVVIPSLGPDGTIELPEPDTGPGCSVDGIWENLSARQVQPDGTLVIQFANPSDGNCATLDGNRQDIISLLLEALDGEDVQVFVGGRYPGAANAAECGGSLNIENRGVR